MISKNMYTVLSKTPRPKSPIPYKELESKSKIEPTEFFEIVCEAKYSEYGYINEHSTNGKNGNLLENSTLSITEKGKAVVEEYERAIASARLVRGSLIVAIIAAVAGIGSAIAAGITLYITLCG